MSAVIERPMRNTVEAFARQARLASTTRTAIEVPPDVARVLADYLQATLATVDDQAWFWTEDWHAGEQEAEADMAAGRVQVFENMEDLISDLGWPQ